MTFKSKEFGRIFWIDDEHQFKSCPLNVDETGDFERTDYVSEWQDLEGINLESLLNIHRTELINKLNYGGSLSLNDYTYGELVDNLVEQMGVTK